MAIEKSTFKGFVFSGASEMFIKTNKGEYKGVDKDKVIPKVTVTDDAVSVTYCVDGTDHAELYVKSEDGKRMEIAPRTEFSINTHVLVPMSGCLQTRTFSLVDGRLAIKGFMSDGCLSEHTYVLENGTYSAKPGYGLCLDLGLTTDEVGFHQKDEAEFFNEFTADGEKHNSYASRVIPSKEKLDAANALIQKLFADLDSMGLTTAFDTDNGQIGVINKLNKDEYEQDDSGNDEFIFVPDWLAVKTFSPVNSIYMSDCWGIRIKR